MSPNKETEEPLAPLLVYAYEDYPENQDFSIHDLRDLGLKIRLYTAIIFLPKQQLISVFN